MSGFNAVGQSTGATAEKKKSKLSKELSGFKKDLKKAESILKLFHHSKKQRLGNKYVRQHKRLLKTKTYPYNVDHKKLNIKVKPYNQSVKYDLKYEVIGWYPYWESDLYRSINFSLVNTLAYFSYEVNPNTGYANSMHDWATTPVIDSVKKHNNRVLLTVTNFGSTQNRQFLNNSNAVSVLIRELKKALKQRKANGVCLDFEGVSSGEKQAYAQFISLLSQALKKEKKDYLIYITVPSVDWAKSLDFQELVPDVDCFVIMGYGYYGSTSDVAGPVDPLTSGSIWEPYNLTNSVDYYLKNKVPPNKLILALPFYGSIWETITGDIESKAKKFVGNRTYDYIKTNITSATRYDTASKTAWASFAVKQGTTRFRQCWFDDDSTLSMKLDFIRDKGLRGTGIWALGYDKGYPDLWDAIAKKMCIKKVVPNSDGSDSSSTSAGSGTASASASDSTGSSSKGSLVTISSILEKVTDTKTLLVYAFGFAVFFGGIGLCIAMFKPNTRVYFFTTEMGRIYYSSFLLILLVVFLRLIEWVNDISIALIVGFIAGGISLYFIGRFVERKKRDRP